MHWVCLYNGANLLARAPAGKGLVEKLWVEVVGGRVERSLTPILDEVWRWRRRRRSAYCVIMHKGYRVRAKENDLYVQKRAKKSLR